jgi:hypothetical protein
MTFTANFKSYFDFNSLVFEFTTICTVFCVKIEACLAVENVWKFLEIFEDSVPFAVC